jgi:diaminopimelate decarboxylase
MYRNTLQEALGANALALYASKAASFKHIYRITDEEGLGVDAVSPGEIHTAVAAGVDPEKIFFHGDGKTDTDIRYAMAQRVGYFVVDNVSELLAVNAEARRVERRQKVLLRLTPGIDPHTYEAVATGRVDSKFGSAIETGQAAAITDAALALPHIALKGFHCHVGSQVTDASVFLAAADVILSFAAETERRTGFRTEIIDLGGGFGVRYVASQKTTDIPARIAEIGAFMNEKAAALGIALPAVAFEPGRSIVAEAGLTLYTVGTVKRIPGYKNYVTIDGGMGDDPRYALYRSRYTVLAAGKMGEEASFRCTLAGRCCESGDLIQEDILLPESVRRGDVIAVCTTGAYNYSMASNYNRFGRPALVMLRGGKSYVAVRREGLEDLTRLDV